MNNLTANLNLIVELHEKLLVTAKKKQQILIRAEMNPLLAILAEESKLIKKMNEADKQRMAILGEKTTLSEIIARKRGGVEKDELLTLQAKLQPLFAEIQQVNQSNQQLLEQSLAFTAFMMEQMLPISDGAGIYSPKASSLDRGDCIRLFDAKV